MISVVIPYYKKYNYISKTIESVLIQNISLEIIIVDDCSNDNVEELLYSYDNCDINYYKLEKNMGVSYARNFGVQKAKYKYIAFIDADDFWLETKLSKQLKILESGFQFVSCNRYIINENDEIKGIIVCDKEITFKNMLKENLIATSSVLMHKEIAMKYPMKFDKGHEDYLCWLNMLKNGIKFANLDEPLLCYRRINYTKSSNIYKNIKMKYITYREFGVNFSSSLFYTIINVYRCVKKHSLKKLYLKERN